MGSVSRSDEWPEPLNPPASTLDAATASLRRRLRFAGDVQYVLDGLASAPPMNGGLRVGSHPMQDIPIQLAKAGFDLLESIRMFRRVPFIGNPEKAVRTCSGPLLQHPRYRTYWYNRSTHTMVGMHLGLDVIRHDDRYFIIENNLGASLGLWRRKIHGAVDPLYENLIAVAKLNGFGRLVPMARSWAPHNIEGFEQAGQRHGIVVVPTSLSAHAPRAAHSVVAMPAMLEPDTLYVFHSGRATALAQYVHNKRSSGEWLAHALPATGARIATPLPSYDQPTVPEVDPGPQWPNLVVKLASTDKGKAILLCRFDSAEEAARTLGVKRPGDIPLPFRRGLRRHARRILYGVDWPIYQPFVPPTIDDTGHTQTIRLDVFVSPLANAHLSTCVRVATRSIPERVAHGIIRDVGPFIGSFSAGFAEFGSVAELDAPESELSVVVQEFGMALHHAVTAYFDVGDA